MTTDDRSALMAAKEEECASQLEAALVSASVDIADYLAMCAADGLQPDLRKLKHFLASGELNLSDIEDYLEESLTELREVQKQKSLARKISENIKLSEYPENFPAHRKQRKFVAVLGPTNSGKTYQAFERLAGAKSGAYFGPLRLLALEAFTRLNSEFGVPTSLVTGEERRMVEGAKVTAATVEMFDPSRDVEVVVIDEIQMLADPDRGWAWTQAVVGANADEVWMLGAESARPAIKSLARRLGVPLEVRSVTRKHPLEVAPRALAGHPMRALQLAEAGDAFIVFSRRDALNLRDDLLGLGKTVACIYGALSPEVREREAQRFSSRDAEILVATDAVGMGLNLPIKRVVFTSVEKFDGEERAELPVPLLQQIGGRAGRYGHSTDEFGVVIGLTPAEHQVVERLMIKKQLLLATDGFMVAPSLNHLTDIATLASDSRLSVLLSLFTSHCDRGDKYFLPRVPVEQFDRALYLDKLGNLSLELKHVFSMAPMDSRHEDIDHLWHAWARMANQGKAIRLTFLDESPEEASLAEAETCVRLLTAYRWFGYRLPKLFVDHDKAEDALRAWVGAVDAHLRSRLKQGVGGGRKGLPSWYWPAKS